MKHFKHLPKSNNMPIIRIAPVCNGKIYVAPRRAADGENLQWDLPIEESVEHVSTKSDKVARKIKEKYQSHIHTDASPRFCVQYTSKPHDGCTAYLYVLPLRQEDEIHFHEGKFVSAEDINNHPDAYSYNLHEESELLDMAAELWKDFYSSES